MLLVEIIIIIYYWIITNKYRQTKAVLYHCILHGSWLLALQQSQAKDWSVKCAINKSIPGSFNQSHADCPMQIARCRLPGADGAVTYTIPLSLVTCCQLRSRDLNIVIARSHDRWITWPWKIMWPWRSRAVHSYTIFPNRDSFSMLYKNICYVIR